MEKKRVVPVWVSVVLLVLLISGIVLNLFTIKSYLEISAWTIPIRAFDCIACILALIFCLKGYSKNAAGFFNIFCIFYCFSCLIPIFGIAETYQSGSIVSAIILLLHLISFACLSIFIVAKDLGKRKSYSLAIIVLFCEVINVVFGFSAPIWFVLGMSGKVILSIVFFIMVYAKYADKAARGTK